MASSVERIQHELLLTYVSGFPVMARPARSHETPTPTSNRSPTPLADNFFERQPLALSSLLSNPFSQLRDWPAVVKPQFTEEWLNDYIEEAPEWRSIISQVTKSPATTADIIMQHSQFAGVIQDYFAGLEWSISGHAMSTKSTSDNSYVRQTRSLSALSAASFRAGNGHAPAYDWYKASTVRIELNTDALALLERCDLGQTGSVAGGSCDPSYLQTEDKYDIQVLLDSVFHLVGRATGKFDLRDLIVTRAESMRRHLVGPEAVIAESQAQLSAIMNDRHTYYSSENFTAYTLAHARTMAQKHFQDILRNVLVENADQVNLTLRASGSGSQSAFLGCFDYHGGFDYLLLIFKVLAQREPPPGEATHFDPSVALDDTADFVLQQYSNRYFIDEAHQAVAVVAITLHGFVHTTKCYQWALRGINKIIAITEDEHRFPVSRRSIAVLKDVMVRLLQRIEEAILHFEDLFVQSHGMGNLFLKAPCLATLLKLYVSVHRLQCWMLNSTFILEDVKTSLVHILEESSSLMYNGLLHEFSTMFDHLKSNETPNWEHYEQHQLTCAHLAQVVEVLPTRIQSLTRKYQKVFQEFLDLQSLIARVLFGKVCGDSRFLFNRYCELHYNLASSESWLNEDPGKIDIDVTRLASALAKLRTEWDGFAPDVSNVWLTPFSMVVQGILDRIESSLLGWTNSSIGVESWEPLLIDPSNLHNFSSDQAIPSSDSFSELSQVPIDHVALFPSCTMDMVFAISKTLGITHSMLQMMVYSRPTSSRTPSRRNSSTQAQLSVLEIAHNRCEPEQPKTSIDLNDTLLMNQRTCLAETVPPLLQSKQSLPRRSQSPSPLSAVLFNSANIDSTEDATEFEFVIPQHDILQEIIARTEKVVSQTLHNFIVRMVNPCLADIDDVDLQQINENMANRIITALGNPSETGSRSSSQARGLHSDSSFKSLGPVQEWYGEECIQDASSPDNANESLDVSGLTNTSFFSFEHTEGFDVDSEYKSTTIPLRAPWHVIDFREKSLALLDGKDFVPKIKSIKELAFSIERLDIIWQYVDRVEFCMRVNAVETCCQLVPNLVNTFNSTLSLNPQFNNLVYGVDTFVPFEGVLLYTTEACHCLKQRLVTKYVGAVEPVLNSMLNFAKDSVSNRNARDLRSALRGVGRFLQTEFYKLSKLLLQSLFCEVVLLFLNWLHEFLQDFAVDDADNLIYMTPDWANHLHHCTQYIFKIFERAEYIALNQEVVVKFKQLLLLFQLYTTPTYDLIFLYLRCCYVSKPPALQAPKPLSPRQKVFQQSLADMIARENSGLVGHPSQSEQDEHSQDYTFERIWQSGLVPRMLDDVYCIKRSLQKCLAKERVIRSRGSVHSSPSIREVHILECSKFLTTECLRNTLHREGLISSHGLLWVHPRCCYGSDLCDYLSDENDEEEESKTQTNLGESLHIIMDPPPQNGGSIQRAIKIQKQFAGEDVGILVFGKSITTVEKNSPAARSGVTAGEVLVAINDDDVRHASSNELQRLLLEGRTVQRELFDVEFLIASGGVTGEQLNQKSENSLAGLEVSLIVESSIRNISCYIPPKVVILRPEIVNICDMLVMSQLLLAVDRDKEFCDNKSLFRFCADELPHCDLFPRSKWNPVKLIPDWRETQHRIRQLIDARSSTDNVARAFMILLMRIGNK